MAEEEIFNVIFAGWGAGGVWFVNSVLAILVVAIIMGTVYALAVAFNMMGLKRYAVSEFLQLAATAVMVIFLVGIIENGQALFMDITDGAGVACKGEMVHEPLEAAKCRTTERLEFFDRSFWEIKDNLNSLPDNWEYWYYYSMSVFGVTIFQGSWVPEIHSTVETGHVIAYKIVSLMISLNAQLFVLKYIQATMLAIFLPLGIVLRTLHFTRGIGGFLIALAVSMYFIYPGVLFMLDAASAPLPPPPPSPVMDREELCNMPVFSGFSLGGAALQGRGTVSTAAMAISTSSLASFISEVFVRLFYDNMVALAIALTAVRYGSVLLGVESGVFLQMMARWV